MSTDYVEPPSHGVAKDNDDVTVDATAGGVTLLASNTERKSALIINVGDQSMRVTTDASAPTATHGKLVPAGTSLVLSSPDCPVAAVKAIRVGAVSTTANASEVI
jgi:hypothetical protein